MGHVAAPLTLDAAREDPEILTKNGEESVQAAGAGGRKGMKSKKHHSNTPI